MSCSRQNEDREGSSLCLWRPGPQKPSANTKSLLRQRSKAKHGVRRELSLPEYQCRWGCIEERREREASTHASQAPPPFHHPFWINFVFNTSILTTERNRCSLECSGVHERLSSRHRKYNLSQAVVGLFLSFNPNLSPKIITVCRKNWDYLKLKNRTQLQVRRTQINELCTTVTFKKK